MALSALARRARDFMRRRMQSGPKVNTGRGPTRGQSEGLNALARARGRLSRTPPPSFENLGTVPPPVDPRAFLGMLEKISRGESVDPRRLEELARQLEEEAGLEGRKTEPEPEEAFDDIELLGRDAGYDEEELDETLQTSVQVSSSNVYSYKYVSEDGRTGILYVTFLAPAPKGQPRTSPGPTYAYYTVPRSIYQRFVRAAEGSAGGAVWDYLRVRGTIWGHQFVYRLISVQGEYIPRRATAKGYRTRYLRPVGGTRAIRGKLPRDPIARQRELERRGFRRSTLPEQLFSRGEPDRGEPDRGQL